MQGSSEREGELQKEEGTQGWVHWSHSTRGRGMQGLCMQGLDEEGASPSFRCPEMPLVFTSYSTSAFTLLGDLGQVRKPSKI